MNKSKNKKKIIIFSIVFGLLFLAGMFFVGLKVNEAMSKAEAYKANQNQSNNLSFVVDKIVEPIKDVVNNVTDEKKTPEAPKESENTPAEVTKEEPVPVEAKVEAPPAPVVKTYSPPSYNAPFQWGVNMRPSALGNYNLETWQSQVAEAKKLGVGWARIGWDSENADPYSRNTEIINTLKNSGINVVLVIEHDSRLGNGNLYQDGYNDGKKISSYYKGKVNYFQLGNEGSGYAIKNPTSAGDSQNDFDEVRYQIVKDYAMGVSDGVRAGNPSAVKIINICWTHTGYLEKMVKDVQFDMIGLDWYSWMGNLENKKMGSGETFFNTLKSFGKPLTFVEINAMPDDKTNVDEERQSEYIDHEANWAWENRDWVKGFYVLELVDNANVTVDNREYFGLIQAITNATTGISTLGVERKSFSTYKDLISRLK